MADDKDLQDRTEEATPKRKEDARRRGQVARSRELNIAAVLLAGALVLVAARADFGTAMADMMRAGLTIERAALDHPETLMRGLAVAGIGALQAFTPLLLALGLGAIGGGLAVGGWIFSAEQVTPKLSRLSPLAGIKRIFSVRSLVEVAKSVAKALLIGGLALIYLLWVQGDVIRLGMEPVGTAIADAGTMIVITLIICSAGILAVAFADVPFQIWSHNRELRMSRQEIVDEMKETEGRPEVRNRIRQLQQQLANRKMLRDVPSADVIVTTPTHFAVALRYDDKRMRAPIVVAKGVDHMAARIREVASLHRVALFEAPLLARALYWTTKVNQEIPGPLYLAVAQVLTYVFRVRAAVQTGAPWPNRPNVNVDATLAEPHRGRRPGATVATA